jgi:hypothetical protein
LIHSIPAEWEKKLKAGDGTLRYIAQQGCFIYLDNKEYNIDEVTTKDIYIHT